MAGPAPKLQRTRRGAPKGGDWQVLDPITEPALPTLDEIDPDTAWTFLARLYWEGWREDPVSATWGPSDRAMIVDTLWLRSRRRSGHRPPRSGNASSASASRQRVGGSAACSSPTTRELPSSVGRCAPTRRFPSAPSRLPSDAAAHEHGSAEGVEAAPSAPWPCEGSGPHQGSGSGGVQVPPAWHPPPLGERREPPPHRGLPYGRGRGSWIHFLDLRRPRLPGGLLISGSRQVRLWPRRPISAQRPHARLLPHVSPGAAGAPLRYRTRRVLVAAKTPNRLGVLLSPRSLAPPEPATSLSS
jgi:hypothetical protein